jgi:hypothetical protein
MNKGKIISIGAMLLLMVSSVLAFTPGFQVNKYTSVTGDWAWISDSWTPGVYETASYSLAAISNKAKTSSYFETETLGKAWDYDLTNYLSADKKGTVIQEINVLTVNDPRTTPGEKFTKYCFQNQNAGDNSFSMLSVSGKGYVQIGTTFNAQTGFQQQNTLDIN